MALRRSQGRGETVILRARILDDQGDMSPASGVAIYIFPPDADTTDLSEAVDSGTPTLFDAGVYEYDYDIPDDADTGFYSDLWFATLNEQALSGVFLFEVLEGGSIEEIGGQLYNNNYVDVTVYSGILALDGAALKEDFKATFLTEVSPAYTEANKVRLEVGAALSTIPDDTLYLSILEASLEAEQLTFNKNTQNTEFFQHARREWTTCRAAATLVTNAKSGFFALSKRLGDLSISYNPGALDELLDRVIACLNKWEVQVQAGGYGTRIPVGVIKGEYDPDRPAIGRSWLSTEEGNEATRHVPAANTSARSTDRRRWQRGYKTRWGS